jgi:tetrahydromethanopterin S-methyltransferase subunit G
MIKQITALRKEDLDRIERRLETIDRRIERLEEHMERQTLWQEKG